MSSSLRRGALAATALAVCTATLTACGAGHSSATLQVSADNPGKQVGDIEVRAVNLITSEDGEGPLGLSARIFNNGDKAEKVEAVSIRGVSGRVKLSPPEDGKGLAVPADGVLAFGGKGNASASAPAPGSVKPGAMQRVTFVLSRTGRITLRAAVVPADHDGYPDFGPSTVPAPSGVPTGNPSPRPSAPSGSPAAGEDESAAGAALTEESPTASAEDGTEAAH
ncbi:DUF461 domain-containing protein [Streptomyces sp. TR06-5]|uniref:DUF461 domain-containing protein n=1 Tax=unclassified Streptomyces TaxID=2593676 RepID=UPI0039A0A463